MKAKRILLTCALALTFVLCMVGFAACGGNKENNNNQADKKYDVYRLYVAYAEDSGIEAQSYEEWLESIQGHSPEITINSDGYWCIDGVPTSTKAKGIDGKNGSVWYNGTGTPAADKGVVGDYYLDTANGDVYEKKETEGWKNVGNIKGTQGNPGTPGGAGKNGSVWYNGTGTPAADKGAVGDYYLDTANGDVYEKKETEGWTNVGNIKGAQGNPGTPGTTTEVSGVNFYSGPGNPSEYASEYAEDAKDGDYYIDTDARTLYQKDGGSWNKVVAFSISFSFGEGEPKEQANVGDLYLDTSEGKLYSYEFSSGWTVKYTFSQAVGGITERGTRVTMGTFPPDGSGLEDPQEGDIHIQTTTGKIYKYDYYYGTGYGWEEVPVDPSHGDLGNFVIKHVVGSHFDENGHLWVDYSDESSLDLGQIRPVDNVKVYCNDQKIASAYVYAGENYTLPDEPDKEQMPENHVFQGWIINDAEEDLKQPGEQIEITGKTEIKAKTEEYKFDGLKGTYTLKSSDSVVGSFTLDGFGKVTAASFPYSGNTLVATGTYENADGGYGGVEYIMTLSGTSGGNAVKSQIFGFSFGTKEFKSEWNSQWSSYMGSSFTIATDSFEGIYKLTGYGDVYAGMIFVDGYGRIFGQYTSSSTNYVISGYYEPDTAHGKPYIVYIDDYNFCGIDFSSNSFAADYQSQVWGSMYMTSMTMEKLGESVTYTLSDYSGEIGTVEIKYDGTVTGSVNNLNSNTYTVKSDEKLKATTDYKTNYNFYVTIEHEGSETVLVFNFLESKFGADWQSIPMAGNSFVKDGTIEQAA